MVDASKLKTKIFNKVIKRLGSTLTITPYTKGALDAYGKRTDVAGTPVTIIAVEAENARNYFSIKQNLNVAEGEISLFIDPSLTIQDNSSTKYVFTWFGIKYVYVSEEVIGRLQDIEIVKILKLRRAQ